MLMSFMGSIGKLMAGSGLEDIFEQVHAPKAVVHIMTGKAAAKAIRAHILTHSALTSLLIEMLEEDGLKVNFMREWYESGLKQQLSTSKVTELLQTPSVNELFTKVDQLKRSHGKDCKAMVSVYGIL